jgi:hypothetical protein
MASSHSKWLRGQTANKPGRRSRESGGGVDSSVPRDSPACSRSFSSTRRAPSYRPASRPSSLKLRISRSLQNLGCPSPEGPGHPAVTFCLAALGRSVGSSPGLPLRAVMLRTVGPQGFVLFGTAAPWGLAPLCRPVGFGGVRSLSRPALPLRDVRSSHVGPPRRVKCRIVWHRRSAGFGTV